MKTLVLYRDNPNYRYDEWLHMSFVKAMAKVMDLCLYGPGLWELYRDLAPIKYNPDHLIKDIHQKYPFDNIVCISKGRMFNYYWPVDPSQNDEWLPVDFKDWNCRKFILEEDYHWESDDSWYYDRGFDVILQRHLVNLKREGRVPMFWFPFSVDTEIFYNAPEIERINRVLFMGNRDPVVYPFRAKAFRVLYGANLVTERKARKWFDPAYPSHLQSYKAALSCGSKERIFPGKVFETLASGTALITNDFDGIPRDCPNVFVVFEDCSNLMNQVENAMEHQADHAHLATQYVYDLHRHEKRVGQLIDILERRVLCQRLN